MLQCTHIKTVIPFFRLLVKFPELNYQLKIKVCIDKYVFQTAIYTSVLIIQKAKIYYICTYTMLFCRRSLNVCL